MHRPARPDFDQYKKELAEVDAKIDMLRKEQDDVKARINRNDPRKGPSADKRGKLLDRLQDIRKEQSSLKKSRGKVFDRHASLTASISKKTADLKAQQSKLTYKTVDAIDEVLAKHQSQIDSGNLKIVEERRLSDEMAGLRRAKKQVEQAAALQKNIEADLAELAEIDEQIAGTNARALGEEYDRLQSELDSLRASQEEGHQKRGELFSERSRILKELDQAWEFKRRLQDDHRRINNEYYQWQQQERIRKANEEKQRRVQELREKRLAIAQEQREEAEIPAFEDEINGCDSLIIYLNSIQPSTTASPGSKSENSTRPSSVASTIRGASSDLHIPAGMLALKKTNDEADYFAGSSSSKSKRRNERKDKKNGPASEILKLPLAVAERFLELEVDIPTTSASIAATIEKLEARKQYFIGNQAKVTNENKRKAEEKIAKLMSELEVDEKIATAVGE
ncbi:multicopy suppressor of BFA (Brefeldin A) [Coemansia interrupta]|uniref:Multicopy suppressor of BFA (Brefeldin A) n=1 Tax=Coemansia interrupta TaxID=1126814 RepID=A0A9W8HQ84_9FUNG|nr:multicopy suppressor of BFA (Brefeldin A) [Coemansia interrupta]